MLKQYSRFSNHSRLQYSTAKLWNDMVSPLCGILTCLYAYLRQTYDPKCIAIGGQLTDPTFIKGIEGKITYHIGGMGMNRDDAMIKCLAESYERYISVMYNPEKNLTCKFDSYENLINYDSDTLIPDKRYFEYFSHPQFEQKNFFRPFDAAKKMLWVKAKEIISKNKSIWLPAHLLFLGYVTKKDFGEIRINGAVSTGTAVHTTIADCLLNSLLENILIDAVMAHWYTDFKAYKIELDQRTRHLKKIIEKSIPNNNIDVEFYWLPSVDFSTFNIACISRGTSFPYFCVGLGADFTLERAMYKAFLEFLGTRFLSNSLAVLQEETIIPNEIHNLDDNVLYYALNNNKERINDRFNPQISLKASEFPEDLKGNKIDIIKIILNEFANTDKQLALIDFTNDESRELGLVATKVWSPQMISLCLPNAVPANHPRFVEYGGIVHNEPHPYP